jgi:hypothetical protein
MPKALCSDLEVLIEKKHLFFNGLKPVVSKYFVPTELLFCKYLTKNIFIEN